MELECSQIINCDKAYLVVILMQFSFLITEFQKQEGTKSHQKNMQLYDTPYEPEGSGVESDSESVVSQRLRESKLPQDDDRPADEYDQPWEWNKVTIPALAGRNPRFWPENSLFHSIYACLLEKSVFLHFWRVRGGENGGWGEIYQKRLWVVFTCCRNVERCTYWFAASGELSSTISALGSC